MTKAEFITELKKRLSGLPMRELEESLSFYGEMIDDRIEKTPLRTSERYRKLPSR